MQKLGIRTIGQLAESDEKLLESHLGKIGNVLWAFANGWDEDPVCKEGYEAPVKSIGNSTTTPRDLENDLDAVSYTHLDVYKRQASERFHISEILLFGCTEG